MVALGAFVAPDAERPERTVDTVLAAEAAGLDLVGIQDHPYQRRSFVLSADDGGDPVGLVRRLGGDVAPAIHEALA